MRRPVLSTLATSLALFAGAGVAALLPIASDGCPGALGAIRAQPVHADKTSAPRQDPEQAAQDEDAVEAARAVYLAAADRNTAAQDALEAAQDAAPTSGYGFYSTSYGVSSAQSEVDLAQSQVNSAQSILNLDKRSRDSYSSSDYLKSYYDDTVDRDQQRLDEAMSDLADAKKALSAAKSYESEIESASAIADQTAAELAIARSALDAAEAAQTAHEDAFHTEYARWRAAEADAGQVAERADRVRVDCQEDGRKRLIVAGVVAVVGGALGSYSFVQRR